jgi:hypothetical protein
LSSVEVGGVDSDKGASLGACWNLAGADCMGVAGSASCGSCAEFNGMGVDAEDESCGMPCVVCVVVDLRDSERTNVAVLLLRITQLILTRILYIVCSRYSITKAVDIPPP